LRGRAKVGELISRQPEEHVTHCVGQGDLVAVYQNVVAVQATFPCRVERHLAPVRQVMVHQEVCYPLLRVEAVVTDVIERNFRVLDRLGAGAKRDGVIGIPRCQTTCRVTDLN
jgi:hypothetical protein